MRLRDLSMVIVITTILILGTTGLMGSDLYKNKIEAENTVAGEETISTTTLIDSFSMIDSSTNLKRSEKSTLNAQERPPLVPHSKTHSFPSIDDIYTYNFSAKEGDKIHLKVTVARLASVQIILMPKDELSDYRNNQSFGDVEKITEASKRGTRSLKAHAIIPEDDEYSLLITPLDPRAITVEVIIGRGLFSSMVVRMGGYVGFFGVSSFFVVVVVIGSYLYIKRKKKYHSEEELEELRKGNMELSGREKDSRSKDFPEEDKIQSSSDNKEFLQYDD